MAFSALAGAMLVGWIADRAGNAAPGAATGALIGAGLAYGVASGHIGPTTHGSLIGAVIFVVIGPGFDDHGGIGSIEGAVIGGLMAWLIFRS